MAAIFKTPGGAGLRADDVDTNFLRCSGFWDLFTRLVLVT